MGIATKGSLHKHTHTHTHLDTHTQQHVHPRNEMHILMGLFVHNSDILMCIIYQQIFIHTHTHTHTHTHVHTHTRTCEGVTSEGCVHTLVPSPHRHLIDGVLVFISLQPVAITLQSLCVCCNSFAIRRECPYHFLGSEFSVYFHFRPGLQISP